jgi:hypothetical protein
MTEYVSLNVESIIKQETIARANPVAVTIIPKNAYNFIFIQAPHWQDRLVSITVFSL